MNQFIAAVLGVGLLMTMPALGQVDASRRNVGGRGTASITAPRTKLETMEARKGAIIVRAYTEIANVQGEDGSSMRIATVELTDLSKGGREQGLMLEVTPIRDQGESGPPVLAYIDADEVGALADALEAMSRLDRATTRLEEFQALYRTRGDLEVRNFNSNGARMASIAAVHVTPLTGDVTWAVAYLPMNRLAEVRTQIIAAGDLLAKMKDENK